MKIEKYNTKVIYAAWTATMVLYTVVVLTAVSVWREVQTQEQNLDTQAQLLARALAYAVEPALTAQKLDGMGERIFSLIKDQTLQLRISLRDTQGANHVVYFWPDNREPSEGSVVRRLVGPVDHPVGEIELSLVALPIYQRVLWGIAVYFGIGILLMAGAAAGAVWVSKPVRNGLRELLEFLREVARTKIHQLTLKSELKEVEQIAAELNTIMRQVEIAQANLAQAQNQLRVAQREVDEYTYVISHDLKEPLRGIDAFSQFLLDDYSDKLDERGRHHLEVIRRAAVRMQRMTSDLLKFSRLSHQKRPTTRAGFHMMLINVQANLQYALKSKNVDLRIGPLPLAVCDEATMTEVFLNLLSNAIKYNDKPHPLIEIGCTEQVNETTKVPEYLFHVRDNGPGIKQEHFERIFQLFQRLHRDEEGTGIGLTIVKRVIEWHGGRIWVESEEGHGTTFYFTLPKIDIPVNVLETNASEHQGAATLVKNI